MSMDLQATKAAFKEWGKRLDDVGVQLKALRDEPESFTKEQALEILEETEKVFAFWHSVQFALDLHLPTDTLQ